MDIYRSKVPHLTIEINDTAISSDLKKALNAVRPEWEDSKLQLKVLTEGITNKLILCKLVGREEDNVLIRIYGNKTDLLIDRTAETKNILLLNSYGLAPKLYATFNNGLVYEFIPGDILTHETVSAPEIYKLIAKVMAKFHKVKSNEMEENDHRISTLWTKMKQFMNCLPDVFNDIDKQKRFLELNVSKQKFEQEIIFLKETLSKLGSPVVFAHNDLLLANVIYQKQSESVSFIDYEYAAFNYQAFDIANHFNEFAGVNDVDYNRFPKKQLQLDWLRYYLEEFNGTSEVMVEDVESLYVQVNKFVLASHMYWILWTLIQAEHSDNSFDFIGYAAIRLKEYFTRKGQLLLHNNVF